MQASVSAAESGNGDAVGQGSRSSSGGMPSAARPRARGSWMPVRRFTVLATAAAIVVAAAIPAGAAAKTALHVKAPEYEGGYTLKPGDFFGLQSAGITFEVDPEQYVNCTTRAYAGLLGEVVTNEEHVDTMSVSEATTGVYAEYACSGGGSFPIGGERGMSWTGGSPLATITLATTGKAKYVANKADADGTTVTLSSGEGGGYCAYGVKTAKGTFTPGTLEAPTDLAIGFSSKAKLESSNVVGCPRKITFRFGLVPWFAPSPVKIPPPRSYTLRTSVY